VTAEEPLAKWREVGDDGIQWRPTIRDTVGFRFERAGLLIRAEQVIPDREQAAEVSRPFVVSARVVQPM
jgi:hypothetical protein